MAITNYTLEHCIYGQDAPWRCITVKDRLVAMLSLVGVALGVAIFGIGAAMLSAVALAGIVIAAVCAASFTWFSLGKRAVLLGASSGLIGALVAWIAMRSMM